MANKLDDLTLSAWMKLVRTQQILLENMEDDLKKADLPPVGWYDVLFTLDEQSSGKLRISDIGSEVNLSKSNITRLIDRMEKKELVVREPCEEDGRGAYAKITKGGKAMKRKMWKVYEGSINTYFSEHIKETDKKALVRIFGKLVDLD